MEADEIRHGIRKPRTVADVASLRPIQTSLDEFLMWGKGQGGRGGRPWSPVHARNREFHLGVLRDRMGLRTLGDITLQGAEKALRTLQDEGRCGKSLNNYREAIRAFVSWCRRRNLMDSDPLDGLVRFDATVQDPRRDLLAEEVGRLLEASPPERALAYYVAVTTGFRYRELRSLRVGDLNAATATVRLRADYAKNRKETTGFLPSDLAAALSRANTGRSETDPLLPGLSRNYDHNFYADLERAGIPRRSFRGKVSFHSLRNTYINLIGDLGGDLKTIQELARHSDPRLTLNVYSKRKDERLRATTDALGSIVGKAAADARNARNCRTGVKRGRMALAAGAENMPQPQDPSAGCAKRGIGSPGRTRTYSPAVNSRMLYH